MIGISRVSGHGTDQSDRSSLVCYVYHLGGILIGNILGLGLAWLQNEFKFVKLDERRITTLIMRP
jgi:hypothetical protein